MRYSFAGCRLDTATRTLVRDGAAVHLSPKAYVLLRLLLEHRPRVMTKQELMDHLWPDSFVVEANLHVLVGELRSAIDEKSTSQSSIKTHHRVGYSFASEVTEQRPGSDRAAGRSHASLDVDGVRYPVGEGVNLVGRDARCDVCLDDPSVSRQHARIHVHGDVVTIEDLESTNGTLVNQQRISAAVRVNNGDTVTFGKVRSVVKIARPEAPTVMMTDLPE